MNHSSVNRFTFRAGGVASATRVLVLALCFSLGFPLNLISDAMQAAARTSNADATLHVWQRLNSPERQAAIARAAEMDKATREAFAAQESANVIPAQAGIQSSPSDALAQNGKKALDSRLRGNDGARSSLASARPKSITEVMFNAATGVVGLPGLAGNQNDPYDPNADQGLGFHADGTARRADGTTGTNAASAGYNGKRAAAYAGQGLGYNPYGNGLYGYQEPGYDPVTGQNYRYGDPTNGGRRTNGQGGYGNLDQFDPQRMLMQRGLNYGMGLANSAAEGLFLGVMESPYGGARARFNFMVDWDGKVNGEGDLLLPWYDSKYTTVYSQFGARTMNAEDSRDRWIGNFGLGQRWYPYAVNDGTGEDAGNLMLGYNAFFDNDFTRSHQRGGVGIEGQYDWLHLASNYYFPLSSWKGSEDFDSNFVKERAAEGWDLRAKGYLPFYRNVALTGAYTQWYGDNVGMFGASRLEKDPKVWSYGLEYTPIPLVSGFVNQRTTEQGRSDTEFGLRFTYHFQMPWEDQIRHDKVAQLRTVGGSRHEFVDRENRIILEYKAKNNYHIEFVRRDGDNFIFRVRNGFDKYPTGTMVRVTPSGTQFAEAPVAPKSFFAQAVDVLDGLISTKAAYAADLFRSFPVQSDGTVWVTGLANSASLTGLTVQAGEASRTFTANELSGGGGAATGLNFSAASYTTAVNTNTIVQVVLGGAVGGEQINWSIDAPAGSGITTPANSNISGTTSNVTLAVNGSNVHRKVTVTVTLNSNPSVQATAVVTIGTALPADFIAMSENDLTWAAGGSFCTQQGGRLPLIDSSSSLPSPISNSSSIDGFGTASGSWPAGLPTYPVWAGTEVTDTNPSKSWSVNYNANNVNLTDYLQTNINGVVCVP